MKQLAEVILDRRKRNYDVCIMVDGPRGNGKSTFIYKLFAQLGDFIPERDIVFSRDDVIKKLKEKFGLIMADEMINAAHNRDFYEKDQKILIKMINMYRDNYNIMAGAVPFFYDLDPQFRKFIALRVTIYDRGKAILQRPGKSLFTNDPWETEANKKLELKMQGVMKRGKKLKLNYTKLTTYWGNLTFGALSKKQEERYHKIKADKRNQLMEENPEIEGMKEQSEMEKLAEKYEKGLIDNKDLANYCKIYDKNYDHIRDYIRKIIRSMRIRKMGAEGLTLVSSSR